MSQRTGVFDVCTHPLAGTHLIEASAGTGKTYSITTLVVRTLLETSLSIDQILVVSFTRAATADLRGRVRARIREAMLAFERGETGDETLQRLLTSHGADSAAAAARLRSALDQFDRAAIYTIHAFCQRVLVEFALGSGEPFRSGFLEDPRELYTELCQDHWAKSAYEHDAGWVETLAELAPTPEALLDLVRLTDERPDLEVSFGQRSEDEAQSLSHLRAGFETCQRLWREQREAILALLDYHGGQGRMKATYKPEKLAAPVAALDRLFAGPAPEGPVVPAGSGLFTPEAIAKETRAKCEPPGHAFFEAWGDYSALAQELKRLALIRMQRELHELARSELPRRKAARNVRTYTDLLVRLSRMLAGPGGQALADAIYARYPAAFIDEFQDTDPVQFSVFGRIYEDDRGTLMLIGDPKQAIYAFRGGDIYAYLKAVRRTRPVTLGTNYRSDRRLIDALGLLYERTPQAFIDPRIRFQAVQPHHRQRLRGPAGEEAPVQIKMIASAGKGRSGITGAWANRGLADLVAGDIVRFLSSDAQLYRGTDEHGTERWSSAKPSDVAVLVRRNADAERVQDALVRLGVHSVTTHGRSVFHTPEAGDLLAVLRAVLRPGVERDLRVALVTHLIGLSANRLFEGSADDALWARWALRFQEWRERWERYGFAPMYQALLAEPLEDDLAPARERLLGSPRGERTMTNLLHLGELLQREAQRRSLGPGGLIQWFARQRQPGGERPGEEELRLESDGAAATIMTVHKAKGLQFPVVWLPYGHVAFGAADVRPLIHGEPPEEAARISLDPDEWKRDAERAAFEQAAEERRVLYVAMTRALHRVTVFWGKWHQRDDAALAALLHPAPGADSEADPEELLKLTWAHCASLKESERMEELSELAASSDGLVQVDWLDETRVQPYRGEAGEAGSLALSVFTRRIPTNWRRTSFTGLTAGSQPEGYEAAADHDEALGGEDAVGAHASPAANAAHAAGAVGAGAAGAAGAAGGAGRARRAGDTAPLPQDGRACGFEAFPRGAGPGVLLHGLFEQLDFQAGPEELEELVDEQVRVAGIDASHRAETIAGVREVLSTPLGGELDAFTLAQLPRERRLDELKFLFPIAERQAACAGDRSAAGRRDRLAANAGGHPVAGARDRSVAGCPGTPPPVGLRRKDLAGVFRRHGWGELAARTEQLAADDIRGVLIGFIDMVFEHEGRYWVVDYKSNYLGPTLGDYRPEALAREMARHNYDLQFMLYALALHRYLALRVEGYSYDQHFGGVRYLFVRGMSPETGSARGVHAARIESGLIEDLSALMHNPQRGAP